MTGENNGSGVQLGFERDIVLLKLAQIIPLKSLRPGAKESKKYTQILSSVRAIGLVEPPVVTPDPKQQGTFFLLDGLLRIEALKDIGSDEVECLVSTDDEAYTYNKRINRLSAVQEHRMIVRAMDRGVPAEQIAQALELDVSTIRRRFRMLDGICSEAVEMLKETNCPMQSFEILRQMAPIRQVEAADLMIGQNNFSTMFAKALLAATPESQLVDPRKKKPTRGNPVTSEQIARMERELASLQSQVKSVEESFGIDNLHLTVAKGYVTKLLSNPRVARWLEQNRHEYLSEFRSIAEIDSIGMRPAAE
ncbi:RepB plasmid partition [Phyllobacterium phragmitis]|uniref:RepB plasmid partition n=1 Tax=Phyllobacterium phragmitis TaxID=2670329 RepID=A0A2S9IRJ9_9HYPH|nr:plasmid partitioning protein RepB C-terminal domain-containing protein [Phyllobacterium phragmitis]PRD43138.1 RepB plasmid partition [Phyllobacterium phragmitis]